MTGSRASRGRIIAVLAGVAVMAAGLLALPLVMVAGVGLLAVSGTSCGGPAGPQAQPAASRQAARGIPAAYLTRFRAAGKQYGVPWVVLAGIGKVESDDGRSALPGVHSGANAFGAAGPMQIGIGGAAGNQWGGAPVHPAAEQVSGVATDADGDGTASVYDPADAIAGTARYLVAHGALSSLSQAVFAYNHLQSYVQAVLSWAGRYAAGGYPAGQPGPVSASQCLVAAGQAGQAVPAAAQAAIAYARQQLGKPYQWGGTGPDAFDCSGLVMAAYRSAGVVIPRTSQQQWAYGPRVRAGQVQPGDLVFFAGSDGTRAAPGHVGLVIGGGLMIEAYATGYPLRIAPYGGRDPVGFTRPWARAVTVSGARSARPVDDHAAGPGARQAQPAEDPHPGR